MSALPSAAASAPPAPAAGSRVARDLLSIVAEPARRTPGAEALRLLHHPPEGPRAEPVSWHELWRGAVAFAARLQRAAPAGGTALEPGDRVVLALPTGHGWLQAFFGTLAAGAVPVPAAPPGPLQGRRFHTHREILETLVADCDAAAVVLAPRPAEALSAPLAAVRPGLRCLPLSDERPPELADPPRVPIHFPRPDDPALIQYTSGSTSRPKGVVLTHRAVLANAHAITEALFHQGARALSWLPLYHDMGLIGCLLTPLYAQAPLTLMPPQDFVKDPRRWLRALGEQGSTVTVAPNFAFAYCCETVDPAQLDGVRLDSLHAVLNGAEPVDAEAIRRFEETFAVLGLRRGAVRPVYGLAENALAVTFAAPGLRVDRVDAERLEVDGVAAPAEGPRSRRLVSVGRPVGDQQVRIADASDRPLPERRVGQVLVRGASVMAGYFRRPAESERALAGGWLHTGDLGYLADGELYLVGRASELIIRYGRNHHPEDLETRVAGVAGLHPGGAAAFAVESEGGTAVVMAVETREREPAARQALAREVRERIHLAFEFGPDDVVLVPPGTIPRTTSGKVQRRRCRQLYLDGAWCAQEE